MESYDGESYVREGREDNYPTDNPFASEDSIDEVLGVLAGAASVCWVEGVSEEGKTDRVFDSMRAANLAVSANERIKEILAADRAKEFSGDPPVLGDYHDEDTLFKFHRSLAKCGVDDVEAVTNTVLNDGLLIRERRPESITVSVKQ